MSDPTPYHRSTKLPELSSCFPRSPGRKIGFGVLQLSWVALGDPDPLEWRRPNSFPFVGFYAVQTSSRAARTLELLLDAIRSEMACGALQLSLVALGDADPLEWRRPLSASCTALTLSKSLDTHLFLSFSPKFPLSHLYPIPEKTTLAAMSSRGSSQVRVTHELGGNNIYMYIVYG